MHMRKYVSGDEWTANEDGDRQHILCEESAVLKLILAFQSMDHFIFLIQDVPSCHTTCSERNILMSEERDI